MRWVISLSRGEHDVENIYTRQEEALDQIRSLIKLAQTGDNINVEVVE